MFVRVEPDDSVSLVNDELLPCLLLVFVVTSVSKFVTFHNELVLGEAKIDSVFSDVEFPFAVNNSIKCVSNEANSLVFKPHDGSVVLEHVRVLYTLVVLDNNVASFLCAEIVSTMMCAFRVVNNVVCVKHKVLPDELEESWFADTTLVNDSVNMVGQDGLVKILWDWRDCELDFPACCKHCFELLKCLFGEVYRRS